MTVYLVGAGPGDPGLLTMRAADLLAETEVVVHDRLAAAQLLDLAPSSATRIDVGKAPGNVAMTQDEINAVLVEHGGAGRHVVRLKGGDPYVFGRGGEEAEVLRDAGIAFEIVPGVTSAIAAAAYAGIPVTHRGLSTHVTIVTGHEDPAKGTTDTDWDSLARAGGTLVILMGAARLAEISARLIAGGRDPETPVAAVRWGTRPEQRTIRTTLSKAPTAGIESPSAIVVGRVATLDLAWFENKPLFGKRVVITRAREQASVLRMRLEALGAEVLELPSIKIEPIDFDLPATTEFGWLFATSANGVKALFERGIIPAGTDARSLSGLKIAAIGPGTAAAFMRYGIWPDLVPQRFVAESLLAEIPQPTVHGERVLLVRAETARDVLPEGLLELGYEVRVLNVYRTLAVEPDSVDLDRVRTGLVDAICFTSSSTVTNFLRATGSIDGLGIPIISIGPVTSEAVRATGLEVAVEAIEHDIDGLVAAVLSQLA